MAALIVVFHHCLLTYPSAWAVFQDDAAAPGPATVFWWLMRTPLYLLFSGPAAVMVFFALSGAVLALTYAEKDRWNYASYLPKRVTRIWLPFFVALFVSAALVWALHPHPVSSLSDWFNGKSWNEALNVRAFYKQALMLGPVTWLDNPMWSLFHELRVSLIFPLLLIAVLRSRTATLLGTAVLAVAAPYAEHRLHNSYVANWVSTAGYLFVFAAGAALMASRHVLRERLPRASAGAVAAVLITALALLLVNGPADPWRSLLAEGVKQLVLAIGALTIVGLALGRRLPVLARSIPHWLGKVSYSLYLIHVPVLLTLLHLSNGRWQMGLLAATLAVSLAAAGLMQWCVERPSQTLGRLIATRLTGLRGREQPVQ